MLTREFLAGKNSRLRSCALYVKYCLDGYSGFDRFPAPPPILLESLRLFIAMPGRHLGSIRRIHRICDTRGEMEDRRLIADAGTDLAVAKSTFLRLFYSEYSATVIWA